jgi:hypothetical protein
MREPAQRFADAMILAVSDSFEERAARRRSTWTGGVAGSFEEMEKLDLAFWLRATPAERLRAVYELNLELMALGGHRGPPPRLQRSVGGVRPRVP